MVGDMKEIINDQLQKDNRKNRKISSYRSELLKLSLDPCKSVDCLLPVCDEVSSKLVRIDCFYNIFWAPLVAQR